MANSLVAADSSIPCLELRRRTINKTDRSPVIPSTLINESQFSYSQNSNLLQSQKTLSLDMKLPPPIFVLYYPCEFGNIRIMRLIDCSTIAHERQQLYILFPFTFLPFTTRLPSRWFLRQTQKCPDKWDVWSWDETVVSDGMYNDVNLLRLYSLLLVDSHNLIWKIRYVLYFGITRNPIQNSF